MIQTLLFSEKVQYYLSQTAYYQVLPNPTVLAKSETMMSHSDILSQPYQEPNGET